MNLILAWIVILGILALFVAEIWRGGGDPNRGGGGRYDW
jgi:hypothetical protein